MCTCPTRNMFVQREGSTAAGVLAISDTSTGISSPRCTEARPKVPVMSHRQRSGSSAHLDGSLP